MAPVAIHVNWTGRVQGVGFRAAVRRASHALGVLGWVRNLPDGAVEALLVGSVAAIDGVLERVKASGYSIEHCTRTPTEAPPPESLKTFDVRA